LPASGKAYREKKGVRVVVEDEPDFARAEEIFANVSRATEHSPRRMSTRSQQQKRSSPATHTYKKVDRVVLVEEPSVNLCSNCHGRKSNLKTSAVHSSSEKEKEKAKKRATAAAAAAAKTAEREKRKVAEEKEVRRKVEREREDHRRTLEGVLERLESEFGVQKKCVLSPSSPSSVSLVLTPPTHCRIYLELTTEYQSMTSRHETSKRRALASHLKKSIDVLEEKARDVKQYADALEYVLLSLLPFTPSNRS
jgi:hypothetical protein